MTGPLRIGPFTADPDTLVLTQEGHPVPAQPLVVELLCLLARRAPGLVSKQELMELLWPNSVVTEHALSQAAYRLRRALGPFAPYVVTVPGKGFRLDAPIAGTRPLTGDATALGREPELARLRHCVAQEQHVWLAGPLGAGRSAVLRALGPPVIDAAHSDWRDQLMALPVAAPLLLDHAGSLTDAELSWIHARFRGRAVVIASRRALPMTVDDTVFLGPLPVQAARECFLRVAGPMDGEIDALCERLDRLPLLIELAAGRCRVLDIPTIHDSLDDLPHWSHPHRDACADRRPLMARLRGPRDRLSRADRSVLHMAALFRGEFLAEDLAEVADLTPARAAAFVHRLIEQGLAAPGFRIWAGVREAARAQLPSSHPVRARYVRWVSTHLACACDEDLVAALQASHEPAPALEAALVERALGRGPLALARRVTLTSTALRARLARRWGAPVDWRGTAAGDQAPPLPLDLQHSPVAQAARAVVAGAPIPAVLKEQGVLTALAEAIIACRSGPLPAGIAANLAALGCEPGEIAVLAIESSHRPALVPAARARAEHVGLEPVARALRTGEDTCEAAATVLADLLIAEAGSGSDAYG